MINPYAPPAADSNAIASVKLYSPGQVAWASFLGTPVAGCVLLAINFQRFGQITAANLALVTGFIGTIVVFAIAFVLPDNFPNLVLPLAYTFGMYQGAKQWQGETYQHRLANGDRKASGWAATGISIVCLICITLVLFAVLLAAPDSWFDDDG
jgi:hypothetical protein